MKTTVDMALVLAGASYNEEDFSPLAAEPGVNFRVVRFATQLGEPDVILLPGTKDVAADYDTLCLAGMADAILARVAAGCWVVGICGGLHMLAQRLLDSSHSKYPFSEKVMMGLLRLDVSMVHRPSFPACVPFLLRVVFFCGALRRTAVSAEEKNPCCSAGWMAPLSGMVTAAFGELISTEFLTILISAATLLRLFGSVAPHYDIFPTSRFSGFKKKK